MDTKDMIQLASRVRAEALKMIHDAGTGHTGGALSVGVVRRLANAVRAIDSA